MVVHSVPCCRISAARRTPGLTGLPFARLGVMEAFSIRAMRRRPILEAVHLAERLGKSSHLLTQRSGKLR